MPHTLETLDASKASRERNFLATSSRPWTPFGMFLITAQIATQSAVNGKAFLSCWVVRRLAAGGDVPGIRTTSRAYPRRVRSRRAHQEQLPTVADRVDHNWRCANAMTQGRR